MKAQFAKRCLAAGICLFCGLALSWSWLSPPQPPQHRGGSIMRAQAYGRRATPADETHAAIMVLLGVSVLGIGIAELVRKRLDG